MKRRTVLQAVGVGGIVSLAGCVEGVREHFQGELRSPVPIEVRNEGSRHYNIRLEAHDQSDQRQTYLQDMVIRSEERAGPGSLDGVEQRFRTIRFDEEYEEELIEQVIITPETLYVLVRISDDEIEIDAPERGEVDDEDELDDELLEEAQNESTTTD